MEFFTNINLLNPEVMGFSEYKDIINQLSLEVLSFKEKFKDDPKNTSGWGHNYFCEEDGGRILFNLDSPKSHICLTCGKNYTDEKRDKTWVYLYRYKAFEIAYKSALLYKINSDINYLNITIEILTFYANNYSEFEIHAKDKINPVEKGVTGFGKIMPQGLNEAIMLITIVNTLLIIKDDLIESKKKKLDLFVLEISEFLYPQRSAYHNIICWIDSAVGCAGIYLGNNKYIESAINSKYGIINQLAMGLTEDFLWYEGSIHYHYFTLEGILNLLLVAAINNHDLGQLKETIKKMLISSYNIAFDNLIFPNPNDGWPNISLKTYSYIYDLAKKVLNDEEINVIADRINSSQLIRETLPLCEPVYINNKSLYGLIFDSSLDASRSSKNYDSKSYIYKDSGFGIIKNQYFNLFLKFAHKSQSHAHPDLLNIELTIKDKLIFRDLSNPGYGSKLYDTWYKKTLSHNSVVIGGKDQDYTENCKVLSCSDIGISAEVSDAYKGSKIRRDIIINTNILQDIFTVECKDKNFIDFVLHYDINYSGKLDLIDSDLIFNTNGYEHLFNIKKVVTNKNSLKLKFRDENISFNTIFDLENKGMFICESYDNPSSKKRYSIIIRSFSNKAKFEMLTIVDE